MRNLIRPLLAAAVAVLSILPATANSDPKEVTVYLKNGNSINGRIVKETARKIELQVPGGTMSIERKDFVEIRERETWDTEEPPAAEEIITPKQPDPPPVKKEGDEPKKDPVKTERPDSGEQPTPPKTEGTDDAPMTKLIADYAAGKISRAAFLEAAKKGGPSAIDDLIKAVEKNAVALTTVDLITMLGELKARAALKAIVPYLESDDLRLRSAAVLALKGLGDPAAIRYLVKTLGDTENGIACHAIDSLVEIHNSDKEMAARVLQAMSDAIFTPDDRLRARATMVFGQLNTETAFDHLLRIAREETGEARTIAIRYLGQKKDVRALDLLIQFLQAIGPDVRKSACSALGILQDSRSVPGLINLLKDEDKDVRERAHWALMQITKQKFAVDHATWTTWWTASGNASAGGQ